MLSRLIGHIRGQRSLETIGLTGRQAFFHGFGKILLLDPTIDNIQHPPPEQLGFICAKQNGHESRKNQQDSGAVESKTTARPSHATMGMPFSIA